jgi:mono/diheme cytochrome c family protein
VPPLTSLLAVVVVATAISGCGGRRASTTDTAVRDDGRAVFVRAGCGGCHTLAVAGTHGRVGPNFDTSERLNAAQIRRQLNLGIAGMPSFRGRLTSREETAVAAFLAAEMRKR